MKFDISAIPLNEYKLLLHCYKVYVEKCAKYVKHNDNEQRVVPISIEKYYETVFQSHLKKSRYLTSIFERGVRL
jgi:hypothetical protein